MIGAIILFTVCHQIDGDTFLACSGERIRLAGIDARERNETCHNLPKCPPLSHRQATNAAMAALQGKTLRCRVVGHSYNRIVADCGVSCAFIRVGIAVRWPVYWRRAGMRDCE